MNTKFFIEGRCYKTPCKTVLNANTFRVEFFTGKHIVMAFVADKCYFESIDNISLSDIKCDFHFSRNYTSPKEFLSKLYDTFNSFLNTSIPFTERHFPHSTDDIIRRILELQEMKKEQFEIVSEPTTKSETAETEETKELLAEEQFELLIRTLYKSLFKAIGLSETRKIAFIISNNMVFFNYNGTHYKYYPSQCKVFKKCGRKYQRINWKDFAEENNPDRQNQNRGRSPPLLLI